MEAARIALTRTRNGLSTKSFILVGLRGVGKTVLLNRVEDQAREAGYLTSLIEAHEEKSLPALLLPELRRILLNLDRGEKVEAAVKRSTRVLKSFTKGLKVTLGAVEIGLDIDPEVGVADSGDLEADLPALFLALGEAARARKTAVAIIIDELQYLSASEFSALIMALHKIAQKGLPLLLVGAGLPQVVGLAGRSKSYAERLFEMAAAIPKSPGQACGKNGFFLSPTSAWCPVSAVQPSVQSPQAFDTAETGQNRREYPRWFALKPQPDRRIGVLFLCPHSFVMPRAPPIHHETTFREYFGALAASAKDLPASLNAASNACGHRAHLISAISVADLSGDNARWAGWRALALRQPAGPVALFPAAVPGRLAPPGEPPDCRSKSHAFPRRCRAGLAPPGERRWWGRKVAMGAAMGRRKQSGDRNVADPGAGGRRNAYRGFIDQLIARKLDLRGEAFWGRGIVGFG